MWVFYLISLPLTLGMVVFTLRYFAGPDVPRYVLFTVGYAWFCSLSIIILVPADIWTTISKPENANENGGISFFWSWSYWGTFLLTWAVVPLIQGFEDAGDFTVTERLKTSVHVNLVFYSVVGSIGLVGLILLITMNRNWSGGILGLAMALSNTFGLVTGAFLLGFGLSEIPKTLWRNADWTIRQKVLSHKVAKMAMKLDEAHQELSNAIVVAQATSNQMSKRDPLRPYMDVIDNMLAQMFREDPSFKPQGGRLGENDMDYDSDEKSMATLRRHLRLAREEYYRYKSEYMTYVSEALQLEDTIKNYECRSSTGWKYVSSFRPDRSGKTGALLDTTERHWLEQGCQVGEQVIPLARNFNGADIEHGNNITDRTVVEMKAATTSAAGGVKGSPSRPMKEETRKHASSREAIGNKYAAMREQGRQMPNPKPMENNITSAKVSLLEANNSHSGSQKGGSSSGLASTWRSMKSGFQSFKANIEARKFLPLRQNQEGRLIPPVDSSDSESLDEIFQRLKRPSVDHGDENENEDDAEIKIKRFT